LMCKLIADHQHREVGALCHYFVFRGWDRLVIGWNLERGEMCWYARTKAVALVWGHTMLCVVERLTFASHPASLLVDPCIVCHGQRRDGERLKQQHNARFSGYTVQRGLLSVER
jgi:hypothetical protein